MKAIFKRTLLFHGPKGKKDKRKFHVSPSPEPQAVPEWIQETDAWELCLSDGCIIPVAEPRVITRIKEAAKPTPATSLGLGDADEAGGDKKEDDPEGKPKPDGKTKEGNGGKKK